MIVSKKTEKRMVTHVCNMGRDPTEIIGFLFFWRYETVMHISNLGSKVGIGGVLRGFSRIFAFWTPILSEMGLKWVCILWKIVVLRHIWSNHVNFVILGSELWICGMWIIFFDVF